MIQKNQFDPKSGNMATRPDEELNECLINKGTHVESCIADAIQELQKSGRVVDERGLQNLPIKHGENVEEKNSLIIFYPRTAILCYSLLFSVLTGAVLLSINLRNTKAKYIVLGFGLLFICFQIALTILFPHNMWPSFVFHLMGCAILHTFFWGYRGANYVHAYRVPKRYGIVLGLMIVYIVVSLRFVYDGRRFGYPAYLLGFKTAAYFQKYFN